MSSGYILLPRAVLNDPLFTTGEPLSLREAFLWLVAKAAWKPKKFDDQGSEITVQRGQVCISTRQLAEAWKWARSKVQRFLNKLEANAKIEIKRTTDRATRRATRNLISVCNYDTFQGDEKKAGHPSGHGAGTKELNPNKPSNEGRSPELGFEFGSTTEQSIPEPAPPADETATQPSTRSTVWARGKPLLVKHGSTPGKAGSMIGKWLKGSSPEEVLAAFASAERVETEDPVSYISATLRNEQRKQAGAFAFDADSPEALGLAKFGVAA